MGPRLLVLLLAVPALSPAAPPPAPEAAVDEQPLRAASLDPRPEALVEFFRLRVARPDAGRVAGLVKDLAGPTPEGRDRAAAELVGRGSAAVPALRRAANALENPDAAARARRCLQSV